MEEDICDVKNCGGRKCCDPRNIDQGEDQKPEQGIGQVIEKAGRDSIVETD